jgi:hypothetical protein
MPKDKMILQAKARMKEIMKDPVARAVNTAGRSRSISDPDEMGTYCNLFPDAGPLRIIKIVSRKGFLIDPIKSYLLENDWTLIGSKELYNSDQHKQWSSSEVWVNSEMGLIHMDCSSYSSKPSYNGTNIDRYINEEFISGEVLTVEGLSYVAPIDKWEDHLHQIEALKEIATQNPVQIDKSAKLGMISHDGQDYYVKTFSLEGKTPEFLFPDLHYGEGFEDFHTKLLGRLEKESKGLVLLHGEPGTGKTQYIRVLLNKLAILGKSVLYVPPSFSSQLTEPGTIEFISDWIIDEEKDCILLIEDAEPLLEIRQGADGRTTGISNLLNMTDGLLNDILGLLVIATFNTEVSKIDPALLRPQRLLARKEFGNIDEKRARELSKELGIECPQLNYPVSLAEFYSVKKESGILLHEVKNDNRKIGFR